MELSDVGVGVDSRHMGLFGSGFRLIRKYVVNI